MDQTYDDGRRTIGLFDLLALVAVIGVVVVGAVMLLGGKSDADGGGGPSAPVAGMKSADVVAKFQAAGLTAEKPKAMGPQDFGLAPVSDDGTHFLIPSIDEDGDAGGRAYVFKDMALLRKTKAYYDDLGKQSGMFFSWTFENEKRGVLVQINGDLPKAKAKRYEAVVAGL